MNRLIVLLSIAVAGLMASAPLITSQDFPDEYQKAFRAIQKAYEQLPTEYKDHITRALDGVTREDLEKVSVIYDNFFSYENEDKVAEAVQAAAPVFYEKARTIMVELQKRTAQLNPEASKLVMKTVSNVKEILKTSLKEKKYPSIEQAMSEAADLSFSLLLLSDAGKASLISAFPEAVKAIRDPRIRDVVVDCYLNLI